MFSSISLSHILVCPPGPSPVPPHRSVEGGQGVPPDHQELVRARDAGQGQPEAGPGPRRAAEHERQQGRQPQRGEGSHRRYLGNQVFIHQLPSARCQRWVNG